MRTGNRVSPAQCGTSPTCASTATCSEDDNSLQDSCIYVRAWRFVQRRLHLRPRASSCPPDMETRAAAKKSVEAPQTAAVASSYCSDWHRVYLLKELEQTGQWRRQYQTIKETAEWTPPVPNFRTQAQRKVAQTTCLNCGLLFFRPLADAPDTSAFCGRDCQSSFQYRRDLQDVVNEQETFRSTGWMQSSEL